MIRILFTITIATFLVSCSKTADLLAEKPVTKTIEFKLAAVSDYSAAGYDSTSAEIKLSVYKSVFEPSYKEQVIWDTVLTRKQLKEYSKSPFPVVITKTYTVLDTKDKIGAGYSISYVTKPFEGATWSAFGGLADAGNTTYKVQVGI